MIGTLVRKILRDLRLPLLVVMAILIAFQCLWVKITQRITGQLLPFFMGLATAQGIAPAEVESLIFEGPGRVMRTLIGGENVSLERAMDILTIGYVHPLMQTIFCIWAIGRASGAIAGELDRGTMELLLAQPVSRARVIFANLAVDLLTIPLLCASLWIGTGLGVWLVGPIEPQFPTSTRFPFPTKIDPSTLELHPLALGPSLWNVAALLFAVGGYTMWLSAAGRFRGRVMGLAVFVTLVQFLINLLGQLWDAMAWLRPFTVFFYYQPQQIVLKHRWTVDLGEVWNGGQPLVAVPVLLVLFLVGGIGYSMALWTFCRRDLPAPL